ncbi:hypothetical protein [Metabacillus indicus]|uniref:hypothetical protein n=1 Tax=Metabacillus indicus TaxID=246786 RepID=UPI003CE8E930
MSRKPLHYFPCGNTAKGYYSLYESVLEGINQVFLLEGGSRGARSLCIQSVSETLRANGESLDILHCPFHPDWLEGLLLTDKGIALLDCDVSEIRKFVSADAIQVIVMETENNQLLPADRKGVLTARVAAEYEKAYAAFSASLKAHDDIEDIYISQMDFSEADQLAQRLIQTFYGEQTAGKTAVVKHRFLGAATPDGAADFIPNLTADIEKRYFIKGRAGSGKSTMLKKIAAAGADKGFDVEIYHCGFDPNSLDMVILRELGLAIFDSTAPHEYEPEKESDEIVDMYDLCIAPGTDEAFSAEIDRTTQAYKEKMKEGITYLSKAKSMLDELERGKGCAEEGQFERVCSILVSEITE